MTVSFSDAQHAARLLLETGTQRYTCLAGGTRSGKTFLIVRAIIGRAINAPGSTHAILRLHSNAAKASIMQETLPAVGRLCFPGYKLTEHKTDSFYSLTNHSRITVGGLDDASRVEKILGLEYSTVFLNEASQISYDLALIAFTRLAQVVPGIAQRAFVDLNPTARSHWTNVLFGEKRDPLSRQPLAHPDQYERAFLNPVDNAEHLSPEYVASLEALPERRRKRFYEGVYVDEVDDALWTYEIFDAGRRDESAIPVEARRNVVVAVDPSGAQGRDDAGSDEIGIVVAARGQDGDAYVLADRSCKDAPLAWARRVAAAYHEFAADCVVAEENFGGAMVEAVIKGADASVPVRNVTASRGKAVRAEPISLRYAAGQVHHVGRFPKLEEQLCAFSGGGYSGPGSPDHADAAIWALTHLFKEVPGEGAHEFMRRMADGDPPP